MITIDQISSLEQEIKEKKKQLAELRRKAEPESVNEYTFRNKSKTKKLTDLFGDKNELILVYNMGKSCPYCTLWADGYNGLSDHLQNRASFVMVSPDEPDVIEDFAKSRNWNFPIYSHQSTSFIKDMNMVSEKGGPLPGVSVFIKTDDGKVLHQSKSQFGPGDNFCIMWDFIDMLPKGVDDWTPKYNY